MMHCCKHCGALLEDEAKVCNFCGTVLEAPQPVAPVPQEVVEVVTEAVTEPTPKKKFAKKKWLIIGGIAAAVIAIAVGAYLLFFNPHIAVDKYFAVMNGDIEKLESLAPQEYWALRAESYDSASVEEYLSQRQDSLENYLLQLQTKDSGIFGKLKSISYKVLDTEKVTRDNLNGIKEALDTRYRIDPSTVHDAYHLVIKITYNGTENTYTYASYLTSVKIGSDWYLIRFAKTQDQYSATFIGDSTNLYN